MPIADRVVPQELQVHSESALVLLEDLVVNEKIMLDPSRNDFPVTLHDPCNLVRWGGIAEPQRRVLRRVVEAFVEMLGEG
mgnify:CR=1 FL=1